MIAPVDRKRFLPVHSFHAQAGWRAHQVLFQCLLLGLAAVFVYGQFLHSPVVFDDMYFFDGSAHAEYLGKIFSFDLRWLPYASFEWTRALLGPDLIWLRLGNLALHIANICLLFLFLRRLFAVLFAAPTRIGPATALAPSWMAFFGALLFALHPAAVYAVAYLTQRSTLMATLFMLVMLHLFLEGTLRQSRRWLIASAGAYLFAALSKEHAVMAPALALALLFLLRAPSRQLAKLVWPTFFLFGLIAAFVVFQVKSRHILGQAYEPYGLDMLARLARQDPGFVRTLAYPLSVLTQSFLFFKYLLLWIVPNGAWMSVDMAEDFARRLWSMPHVAGLIGFVLYPLLALRLLLRRGRTGMLGFALLCPWLLFATEFSTVRIQESFVLYRSYLWMAGLFGALPFVLQSVRARTAAALLTVIALGMIPGTWQRLTTFSDPVLLWDDAARLVKDKESRPGVERIYYNRGIMLARKKLYPQAIVDYTRALAIHPQFVYAYHDRGAAYLAIRQYGPALNDFDQAIALNATYYEPYLGKALVYETLNDPEQARWHYKASCLRGAAQGCRRFKALSSPP